MANINNLVARFSTLKATIQLHAPTCSVVAAYDGSPVVTIKHATLYPWTTCEAEDAVERGLKVTLCKCAKK